MSESALIDFSFSLLLNAALLLSLVQVLDLAMTRGGVNWLVRPTWVVGLIVGVIGILLVRISTTLMPGVVFDTRSILLAICGVFLGPVPTLIAMAMTAAYRWSLGGAAAVVGVLVVFASGLLGMLWRSTLSQPIESIGWRRLYTLGFVVHLVMLTLMMLLPWETARAVLQRISLPVLLIYPLITVALGLLLAERLQRQHDLAALREREERFKRLFEDAPVALAHTDRNGVILAQNKRFSRLFGYTPAEIPRVADWWPLAYPDPKYRHEVEVAWSAALARVADANEAIDMGEYRVTCRDGSVRVIRMNSMTLAGGLLTAFFDLSEIRRVEQALTETQSIAQQLQRERQQALELLGAIADATDDAIFAKDREGRYLLFNRAASLFVGRPAESVLGRDDRAIFPPEQAEMLIEAGRQAMLQEQTLTQEEVLDTAEGKRIFLATKGPLRDTEGRIIGQFGISRDITALKRAEQERQALHDAALQQQKQARIAALNQMEDANAARARTEAALVALRESEGRVRRLNEELEDKVRQRTAQLEAVNRELEAFSYSVSHDLKAPLRGIDGYSRLLEEDYRDRLDAEGLRFLQNIRQGTAQMHQLIEDLLNYSRLERRSLQKASLDLSAIVQGVIVERRPEIEQSGVVMRLEVPSFTVSADREGLVIVLRNLLENAIKFSRGAQPPTIEVGASVAVDSAILWVRDNGIGFDMKFHDRIFDMFQRLQRAEDYPGTGIGLALVRKAMQRMGGRVWAESVPGAGATFYLELPR